MAALMAASSADCPASGGRGRGRGIRSESEWILPLAAQLRGSPHTGGGAVFVESPAVVGAREGEAVVAQLPQSLLGAMDSGVYWGCS